jgi:hypothetical protein
MPPPQSRSESPRERAERHAAAAAAAEAHAATEAERAQIKEATKHMRRQKTTPRSPKEERRAAAAAAAAALGEVEEQRKCLAELRKQHAQQQQQPRVDRELEALWRQALAHKLTHNAGVKNMRAAVQSGRFSCEHYIAIWRGRLESLEREPEPEPEPEPELDPQPGLQVTGPSGAREGTSVAAAVDFQAVQRQLQTLTAVVGSIAGAVESLEAERNHALTWSLCGPLVAAALLGGAVGAAITGVRLLPPPVGVG